MQAFTVLLALGALLVLFLAPQDTTAQLCSLCECPAEYNLVCGYNRHYKKYRGFSSKCVLDCGNKCRKEKYEFLGYGRCGKYERASVTPPPLRPPPSSLRSTTASPNGGWNWLIGK